MRDYSMELANVAASIVTDVMGPGLTAKAYYTSDSNSIIIEFNGYPLYGSRKTGKVFVQFPRSTFCFSRGDVQFSKIQQSQCRYYQSFVGQQFAHPHVYNDGHPCWDTGAREHAVDFVSNIIETLALENVTKDSVTVGRCASGIMGIKLEALHNAQLHKKKVLETLKSKPFVTDRTKLVRYVSKRWCSKITILTRSA